MPLGECGKPGSIRIGLGGTSVGIRGRQGGELVCQSLQFYTGLVLRQGVPWLYFFRRGSPI